METPVYVEKADAFSSGASHACPQCGQEVTAATLYSKIEPDIFSFYVRPCGHRLGLWSKAPDWIADVQVIDPEEEYARDEQRRAMEVWNEKVRRFNEVQS